MPRLFKMAMSQGAKVPRRSKPGHPVKPISFLKSLNGSLSTSEDQSYAFGLTFSTGFTFNSVCWYNFSVCVQEEGCEMLAENRFVVLCDAERQERYSTELHSADHQVEMLDDVVDVLKTCIRHPPLAVIVDMVSGRKMNGDAIVALTNLELSWPILRCRKKPGGGLMVISTSH